MVEHQGQVKAEVIKNRKPDKKNLKSLVRQNVDTENATLISDEYEDYIAVSQILPHRWYVDGENHTKTVKSFWALLKRGIVGQYHKVSLRYLGKYIDEFSYRWNRRKDDCLFATTLLRAVGGPTL